VAGFGLPSPQVVSALDQLITASEELERAFKQAKDDDSSPTLSGGALCFIVRAKAEARLSNALLDQLRHFD